MLASSVVGVACINSTGISVIAILGNVATSSGRTTTGGSADISSGAVGCSMRANWVSCIVYRTGIISTFVEIIAIYGRRDAETTFIKSNGIDSETNKEEIRIK